MTEHRESLHSNLLAKDRELTLLLHTLEDEQEILCSCQPDGARLLDAAEAKTTLLATLKDIEQLLDNAQTGLGFPAGAGGRLSAACEADCVDVLQRVNDTTRRVYRLNEQNGHVLEQRMAVNHRLLAHMRDAQGTVTYSRSGRTAGQQSTISSQA